MIRRKNYFIKKRFQLSFLYRFVILLLLEAVFIAGLLMYISSDTLTTGYHDSILTIENTPNFFLVPTILIILIVGLGIGIAGMIVFIFLSHRIAGPLYRFEQDLKEVSAGDLTKRINLRKTDQLMEIKESINMLIGLLDERIRRIKKHLLELEELVSKKDDPESVARIRKIIELLKEDIDKFRITSGPNE